MNQRRAVLRCVTGLAVWMTAAACGEGPRTPEGAAFQTAGQAVSSGPDFVVTSVKGPPSVRQGGDITVSVEVCNQGTQEGNTDVDLYLSADGVITPPVPPSPASDLVVGHMYIGYLSPGQCQTRNVRLWLSTEGTYYLGAGVDPSNTTIESNENNNLQVGNRIGVGDQPDFVVTSVTGPTSMRPGDVSTASVEVCNQGTQWGSADVELYLSADEIITPSVPPSPASDVVVVNMYIGYLNPGQCRTVRTPFRANTQGTFYLGAVVDPSNSIPELIDDNNTRVGNRIGVGDQPDFVVTSVTGPTSMRPGDVSTASVEVCNQGTQWGSADVELYLSADEIITPSVPPSPASDVVVVNMYIGYLNPGQCRTVRTSFRANTQGTFYLGAVVDPSNGIPELIDDNNTRVGNRIGVGDQPDFVVTSVTGPTSMRPGEVSFASVEVCNQGTRWGSADDVELYLSADEIITPSVPPSPASDVVVGNMYIGYLNPGQCRTVRMPFGANTQGTFYLGAATDPSNGTPELFEDNNTRVGNRIGIGDKPDFVVTSVTGPTNVNPSQQFSATATVCNQGTVTGSTEVRLYLSQDAVITPYDSAPDFNIGWANTAPLAPDQCQTLTMTGLDVSWRPEGSYYLGASVDPYSDDNELLEDNNTRVGNRIGVGNKSDLVVTSVTGPANVLPGQQFPATVTVCNQGTVTDGTNVALYLSYDSVITPVEPFSSTPDFSIGWANTDSLAPGQCQTLTITGQSWLPEGSYYLGAAVDIGPRERESSLDNKTRVGNRIGVGYKSDLVVTSVTGPASVQPNQQFSTTVTVCNQGTVTGSTGATLYLSYDSVITPIEPFSSTPDFSIGWANTDTLAPGQCQTLTITGQGLSWLPEGTYYLGAAVDMGPSERESSLDNKTRVGNRIGVGYKPDLVVTSVTGPASVQSNQQFSATVTVCNQGTVTASTYVTLYLSYDSVITPAEPFRSNSDFSIGWANTDSLAPGQCQTMTMPGQSWLPAGTYYLGAAADLGPSEREFFIDNNTQVGASISVLP
ncbi:CARDB domain-containing protein [Vitiosangium sp. GDMCC 1.1324]|uniref:CARDB domain-containing protein n=1 Tax=Vitiosangium sp. (strain GDMCC 1.1324) TaxID=2138576 RepID=UPI0011B6C7A6|nr:CARDB domain-containing protein [Vitiosangium sp. GDMCC 1.1324]